MLSDELFEKVRVNTHRYEKCFTCETQVSEYLKLMKKSKKPFGGVQLILVGDPFQLCPVEGASPASVSYAKLRLRHRRESHV